MTHFKNWKKLSEEEFYERFGRFGCVQDCKDCMRLGYICRKHSRKLIE
jgi:hypothetical protein